MVERATGRVTTLWTAVILSVMVIYWNGRQESGLHFIELILTTAGVATLCYLSLVLGYAGFTSARARHRKQAQTPDTQ